MENLSFSVSPMFAFKVIGFERIFTFEEVYKEIPKFWNEICEKYWGNISCGKPAASPQEQAIRDNCICEYGVCIDDVGNGKFRYMIAGKINIEWYDCVNGETTDENYKSAIWIPVKEK